ncbi:MAG: ATP-binding protein [Ginsengibacter sp.]
MSQKLKILHLEDLQSDAELVARELLKGKIDSEILVCDNRVAFVNAIKNFSPDIILSDHSLPSFNSFEALEIVNNLDSKIPFILITSTVSEEFAVDVMKKGADDYILKDRLQRLPAAIINSIEKHHLEEEQKSARERLLFHIENTPLGFIEWDNKGFAKTWSKRAEEIFGWSAKEFIESEKGQFSHVHKEDLPIVNKLFEQMNSGEIETNKIQNRNITKDGRVIWCEWFNSVLKDKDGKINMFMSLVQDITEQKQLEWRKDNFLSIVSHELKTPLTTIKAYGQIAENILEKSNESEALGMIKRMGVQVNKLTSLVQDLLDFTKIQNGKLMYNETSFDFNELVKEVIDDMQNINTTHAIKSNLDKTETFFGDRDKLGQVLNNLISNAVKYSPQANSILLSTQLQQGGVQLSVQDFGIGILEQDRDKVFEQFYRVSSSRSTYPGMGIGLYICSEIITRHGGRIWVNSNTDKGSTFHFWLPLDHRKSNS